MKPSICLSACLGTLVASIAVAAGAPPTTAPLSPEMLAIHARASRPAATAPALPASVSSPVNFNSEQGPGPGAIGPGPGCNVFPAPASVGASVSLSYFGPPPSSVNQSLVGPVQLLNSGQVDAQHGT